MNIVYPVTSREEVGLIEAFLRKYHGDIYGDIWRFGVNVPLPVNKLLSLEYNEFKTTNKIAQGIVDKRREMHPHDFYIFQVKSNRTSNEVRPISRISVSRAIKDVGDRLGLNINCLSMRKTREWLMQMDGVSIKNPKRNNNINQKALEDIKNMKSGDMLIYDNPMDIAHSLENVRSMINLVIKEGGSVYFKSSDVHFSNEKSLKILNLISDFQQDSRYHHQRKGIEKAKKKGVYEGRKSKFTEDDIKNMVDEFEMEGSNKTHIAKKYGITRQHLYRLISKYKKGELNLKD
jgi:DNA invertase Pin-like site-specific DNA recombinase